MPSADNLIYEERLSSPWTERLFAGLTLLFLVLLIWRIRTAPLGAVGVAFFLLFGLFLFYSLNYRTLVIHLTADVLRLKFGVFAWTIPLENVRDCRLDDVPPFKRYGGAGIHFMLVHGRYRASFNFLEHPRVAVALKRKVGMVWDVSFSTRRPDDLVRLLQGAISARNAA